MCLLQMEVLFFVKCKVFLNKYIHQKNQKSNYEIQNQIK